ncbi:MAG: proprotein convertase P-domain-containing protein, partial [Bacteroidota bacterium]
VTAVYSAPGAPIITPFNFTEPSCCGSSAGTIAVTTTNGSQSVLPNGTTQVVLCPGGSFQLTSNNNFTLPPAGCANCIPELMYAIYTSPGPTVPDPDLDPNWTGYYWTGQDITTANAAPYNTNTTGGCSPLLSLPAVAGYANPNSGNNTLVIVPITADDGDNEVPSSTSLGHDQNNDGCFDIGDPISVTFLNPISFNPSASCNGTVTIEISGGYPQFFNGVYTVTNTGSGTLSSTSAVSGGNVTISGLTPGQTYSISVNGGSGCAPVSHSGVYSGPPVVNISPNPATICQGGCVTLGASVTSGVSAGNRTFNSNQCSSIPDAGISSTAGSPGTLGGSWSSNSINVNGVCDNTWNTGDPLIICLNIEHTYLSDLSIYIQAPNGVYYLLCDDVGGTGNNFTGTCFSAVAAGVIPAPAINAPYPGSYRPEGAGNNFGALNGTAINGTWTLWVGDQFAGDAGTLSSWSITLGNQNTFTYNWSPATGLSATNILNPTACPNSSTTYTLTVTNSCGCSTTASVPVTVLPPLTPTFNAIGPICSGSTPPTLPGTSNNGINGTWSPNVISNTASGTYTFTPTAGQCASTATLSVTVGNGLNLSTVASNPVCFGGANGSITVSATGGAAPLTYVWNGSA